jgi:hypothetical protein
MRGSECICDDDRMMTEGRRGLLAAEGVHAQAQRHTHTHTRDRQNKKETKKQGKTRQDEASIKSKRSLA